MHRRTSPTHQGGAESADVSCAAATRADQLLRRGALYRPQHPGHSGTANLTSRSNARIRLPAGNITGQVPSTAGPTPKDIALTGGTGGYRTVGGDATLVEFGNGKGRLTLHVLSLAPQGGSA